MEQYLVCLSPLVIGVICILIGISNRKGNISLLHSYHRKRVSEEDRLPFGKLVGLGMMIIGVSLFALAAFMALAVRLEKPALSAVGSAVMLVGTGVGLGISFWAMKKYNHGIF